MLLSPYLREQELLLRQPNEVCVARVRVSDENLPIPPKKYTQAEQTPKVL